MRKKHRNGHIMPINCQIVAIRRIIKLANPWIDDPDVLPTEHRDWQDDVDPLWGLDENLSGLRKLYPKVKWSVPKRQRHLRGLVDDAEIDKPMRLKEWIEDNDGVIFNWKLVNQKKRRIQITLPPFTIGRYGLLQIYFAKSIDYDKHDNWMRIFDSRNLPESPKGDHIWGSEGMLLRKEVIIKPQSRKSRYGTIQLSSKKDVLPDLALVQLFLPFAETEIEGWPHEACNKTLKREITMIRGIRHKVEIAKLKKREKNRYTVF